MLALRLIIAATVLLCIFVGPEKLAAEPPVTALMKLHTQEAESYKIYRDKEQKELLEFHAKPIFNWTNLVGEHTQYGHLFVWTHAGRPEVIGTMFSTRASDFDQSHKRMLVHEFHTLATARLFPVTPQSSAYQWSPEKGITLAVAEGAPPVADSSAKRLAQMRALARSFAAEKRNPDGQTWELRLLPTPLWHYTPGSEQVVEGALFAMVSSEGTDPEVLLLIEARHPANNNKTWAWHTAALRFSDKDLVVKYNGKPLWSSLDNADHRAEIKNAYNLIQTPDKTYMCYRAHLVDELPDTLP